MPDRVRDPKATKVFRAEQNRWSQDGLVQASYQPMVYGQSAPKEAGVDVRLGLDFVKAAESHAYDAIVLFSGDSDLFPAIQDAVQTTTRVELAAWSKSAEIPGNLLSRRATQSFRLWTHRLDEDDFWWCQDDVAPAAA
jgi:hypothetical protein